MRIAEQVTFGGSGLDRAAQLRGDSSKIDAMWADEAARTLIFWRDKPLIDPEKGAAVLLPTTHPLAMAAQGTPFFLGLDQSAPRFAADISAWQPEGLNAEDMAGFVDATEQQHPDAAPGQVFCELRRVMAQLSPRDAELVATAKGLLGWHATHGFCSRCGAPSAVSMAGWQRSCPDCGGQHFPRTDPVVIMLITRGNKVLMGRSPGWPEGMYSLLAGFVEPGEPIEAAVRREVFEEAGIRVGAVDYLASQPWPYPSSLMFGCRGEALNDDIVIDPAEIEEARWISREEMLEIFAGNTTSILPARKGAIAQFILMHWLADRLN